MQKWEYMWTHVDNVNEAGFEGWEAIGFLPVFDGQYNVLMKRPIPGEPAEMTLTEFVEYGVWLGRESQWIEDSLHRVITGSKAAMTAQAANLGPSWGAEARALPKEG